MLMSTRGLQLGSCANLILLMKSEHNLRRRLCNVSKPVHAKAFSYDIVRPAFPLNELYFQTSNASMVQKRPMTQRLLFV